MSADPPSIEIHITADAPAAREAILGAAERLAVAIGRSGGSPTAAAGDVGKIVQDLWIAAIRHATAEFAGSLAANGIGANVTLRGQLDADHWQA